MKFKRFMSLAMAGVMTLALAGSSYAAGEPTTTEPKITKEVKVNQGVTIPDDTMTFHLEFVKESPLYNGAESPLKETLEWDATAKTGGKNSFEVELGIAAKLAGAAQGEYVFKVTEAGESATGYGWQYDTAKADSPTTYWVRAFVPKKDSGKDIQYVAYEEEDLNKKATELKFENKYTERGGSENEDPTTDALKIKKVIGANSEYANEEDDFTFKVEFKAPEIKRIDEPTTYTGKVAGKDITVNLDENGVGSGTFTIKANQEAVFNDIPAGASYKVTEENVPAGYKKAENSGEVTEWTIIDGQGATATITNDYQNIPMTGLALNIAPFIAMFAAVAGAIALYVAAKRRVR